MGAGKVCFETLELLTAGHQHGTSVKPCPLWNPGPLRLLDSACQWFRISFRVAHFDDLMDTNMHIVRRTSANVMVLLVTGLLVV